MSVPPAWQIVLPVKRADRAKSRLLPPPGVSRVGLARAIAGDTIEAVAGTLPPERVVVVTSDDDISRLAVSLGARVVTDPGQGLNGAVRAGLRVCAERVGPVAVLLADLPALRPQDLATALAASARHTRAVVPDRAGTGTVLLTSTGPDLHPSFGPGSAARHARQAVTLDLPLPRLRQDVDDEADLRAARLLGLGGRTQAVLLGWVHAGHRAHS